jgi:hypothetical protein
VIIEPGTVNTAMYDEGEKKDMLVATFQQLGTILKSPQRASARLQVLLSRVVH